MQIEAIGSQFDCKIKTFKPLRAVYMAETDKGSVIVKEIKREPDKIWFIHDLKEYLYERGADNVDRFMLTKNGMPFHIEGDKIFVMEKFIQGRECSFANPYDRENAAMALAELHLKGEGYTIKTGACERNHIGRWKRDYLKKIEYLTQIKETIVPKRKKDFFDKLFLKDVDFMLDMAWQAFDTLKESDYERLSRVAKERKTICHHDYTYHNIIIGYDGRVNIIDFDYSCHELPIYDLTAYAARILKRFDYDMDLALKIIDDYSQVRPVSRSELKLMLSLFQFPQRFWRVSERYYENKSSWSEKTFVHKYEEAREFREMIAGFAEEFKRYI